MGNPAVHHAGQVTMVAAAKQKLETANDDEGDQLEMLEDGEEEMVEQDPPQED